MNQPKPKLRKWRKGEEPGPTPAPSAPEEEPEESAPASEPTSEPEPDAEPTPVDRFREAVTNALSCDESVLREAQEAVVQMYARLDLFEEGVVAPELAVFLKQSSAFGGLQGFKRKVKQVREHQQRIDEAARNENESLPDMENAIWLTDEGGNPRDIGQVYDEVFNSIVDLNAEDPTLFNQDGWISIETDKRLPVDTKRMNYELATRLNWFRISPRGYPQRAVRVPEDIVSAMLTHPRRDTAIPKLRGISNAPLFTPDGMLISMQGYEAATGYYLTRDFPEVVLLDSIDEARDILLEPFQHFPFISDTDKAHAFAFLFTVLIRNLIDGCTPFFHFGASKRGTGKGLLASALTHIATGAKPHLLSLEVREVFGGDRIIPDTAQDSVERKMGQAILKGAPVTLFDNVMDTARLKSPVLEMVATAQTLDVKVLYEQNFRTIEAMTVWGFTGNNLSFIDDLARRVVHICLAAEVEFPERRQGLPPLLKDVAAQRMQLLSAALTAVHTFFESGCPFSDITFGSFEEWTRWIGGILTTLGIDGFNPVETQQAVDTADEEQYAMKDFVLAVWHKFHEQTWRAKDVTLIASHDEESGEGDNILEAFLVGVDFKSVSRVLTKRVLNRLVNQVYEYDEDGEKLRLKVGVSPVKKGRTGNKTFYIENLNAGARATGKDIAEATTEDIPF